MWQQQAIHPDAAQLNRYATGRLSSDESRFIGRHLDDCTDCCQQIEALGTPSSLVAADGDSSSAADANGLSQTEFMARSNVPLAGEGAQSAAVQGGFSPPGVSTRYQVIEQFAEGGMGAIFRARDLHLERDVALKVLVAGRNQEFRVRRFRSEANVLGQLQHPGIPPVFDQGQLPDGRPFIAMKLIEGQTLAELLEQRSSSHSDLMHLLGVFKQICETVAFAHARGMIHRDLKPENIMVGAFGEVQVMDWGLAKQLTGTIEQRAVSSAADFVSLDETATLPTGPARTMAGAVIGTPAYMPPEQAGVRSRQIDERADIFSLGAILCEILTGQPPYRGETSSETFEQARSVALESAWQRLAASEADERLVDLARRCLSPDPDDRIQSALQIAAELEAGFESSQQRLRDVELAQARHEQQRQRRRLLTVLVVVVSVFVTTFTGGWAFVSRQNDVRHRRIVEEVSTALGEASLLREEALDRPLDGELNWSSAQEVIRRAHAVAAGVTDSELLARVRQLSSQIEHEADAARRDRELVAGLAAADAPVYIPDLPDLRLDDQYSGPGPRSGRGRTLPPPPRGRPNHDGRPPDRARMPPAHRRETGPQEGIAGNRAEEVQAVHARLTAERYMEALGEFDLDPHSATAERAARYVMTRPDEVRNSIVASLDSWLSVLCHPFSRQPLYRDWVLAVLTAIDPDPERISIRALVGAADHDALYLVARDEALLTQSPAFIWLVAGQLNNPVDTISLLREARARYPASYLINQQLGEQLVRYRRGHEAIDAFIAALAIKPDAPTNVRAAFLLADHGRHDEAIAMFRNAIRIDPDCADAYAMLAEILTWTDRATEAVSVADDALARFAPDHDDVWQFYVARGEACEQLQEHAAALEAYRHALDLDPLPASDRIDVSDRVLELETGLPN